MRNAKSNSTGAVMTSPVNDHIKALSLTLPIPTQPPFLSHLFLSFFLDCSPAAYINISMTMSGIIYSFVPLTFLPTCCRTYSNEFITQQKQLFSTI